MREIVFAKGVGGRIAGICDVELYLLRASEDTQRSLSGRAKQANELGAWTSKGRGVKLQATLAPYPILHYLEI